MIVPRFRRRNRAATNGRGRSPGGDQRGFSLMETLVAVVLFSIAFVFLFQMLYNGRALVELEGDRRMALRLAQYKIEEFKLAGYSSSGDDDDWTSLNLDAGNHPTDPSVLLDSRGTEETEDDLYATLKWAVRETTWVYEQMDPSDDPVSIEGKIVVISLEWPEGDPYDGLVLSSAIGK